MEKQGAATKSNYRAILLIAGILLIATNLRAPITGVSAVLFMIRDSFDLTTTQAGVLTTLPLVTFAVISPFSSVLAREYGLERALFGALVLIGGGIALRSLGPEWSLFLGTLIVGSGIAIGNVLLPSLLKRDFPGRIAAVTGAYVVTMAGAAALGAAVAVPLGRIDGWPLALAATAILPLAAAVAWIPQLGSRTAPAAGTLAPPQSGRIWKSALAWQVTLFMGINAFLFYVLNGWLPAVLTERGYSPAAAGSLLGLMQLSVAIPGLVLGPIVARMRDQRGIAVAVSVLAALSLVGLIVLPGWAALWAICFGVGTGAAVILSLIFLGLRAASPHQAAALSGMAQCVGYLLAAAGPPLMGALHDASGGWVLPLVICTVLALVLAVFGLLAGRARHIEAR